MSLIELSSTKESSVTVISNHFIDTYMPAANGSYVKVYLYLLRCLSSADFNISITDIADRLEDSEKDIMRALNYWEKVEILTLERSNTGEITHITVNPSPDTPVKKPVAEIPIKIQTVITSVPTTSDQGDKPFYSPTQVAELTGNDEVKWLLKIVEVYLERFLKPADIQLILYLYESVGFSTELIMYLYEYCISKNKKKPSYIEAVALAWAEEGIDTVEKAELNATVYNTNYNGVNKAFGLNRVLGNVEKQYINKWLTKFGFDLEIIVEACNRTILLTQKPDFKYADRILESWNKSGVHHLDDIKKLDMNHTKSAPRTNTAPTPQKSNNKFNAFPQRTYTKEDYTAMEQRLLNSTRQ